MELIIARHGETEENKAGILQGHTPGRLSDLGKEQAQKLALRLKDEKIDYIYSSDLARAADTAKAIAEYHPNTPIEFVQEMRERDLGKLSGKKKSDLGFNYHDMIADSLNNPDIESKEQLHDRAERFVKKVIAKHPNETVLLVGHNGINKNLISAITGEDVKDIPAQLNTSVNIFEISAEGGCTTHISNCVKHLE